jgi:hypothetical protein
LLKPNEEQMGSSLSGDADLAIVFGLAALMLIKMDRVSRGRVRIDDRT